MIALSFFWANPLTLSSLSGSFSKTSIVEEMGTACKGTCEQGGECFKVSYNPLYREGISKDRLSALRAQYPDIYDEFVDQTESRIFKVVKSAIA